MKRNIIIANWKMNPVSLKEAEELFDSIKRGIKNIKGVEVVICPPFIYLPAVARGGGGLALGTQNCFWEEKGAFTGEVSAVMLKNLGIEYIIVGHSERRKYFKETDEEINKKLIAVLEVKLIPILCVGETQEEKNKGETEKVLRKQIKAAFKNVSSFKFQDLGLCIAYEPVWAIGTGDNCSIEETIDSIIFIRQIISEFYNKETSEKIRILYGGSVNSQNSADYIKKAGANGLLVGGASLNADEFLKIVKSSYG